MRLRRLPVLVLVALSACANGTAKSPPTDKAAPVQPLPHQPWTGQKAEAWTAFDRLEDEQKYEEAARWLTERLAAARAANDGEEVTRCLVRWTQLRIALHGYETAVRFLRDEAWPNDLLGQAVLNLYYGASLVTYAHAYSWEINQRERIDTRGQVDLKAWTMEQIFTEAQRAYEVAWQQRAQLGRLPRDAIGEYLTANTFPDDVRPTLRDALTYLRVELLADTQGWRAEQSNQLYTLDLARLAGDKPVGAVDLVDPAVHPLLKLAAALDDLERWHLGRKAAGAALEARLVRLERLHESFTGAEDRARLRAVLTARLPAARAHAWWAEGMARLAEMTENEEAPDNLVRARGLAQQGLAAFPGSPGAEHCRSIVEAIDQPSYALQAMGHDSPGQRSIAVRYKNLTALYFRAYARDLKKLLDAPTDEIFLDHDAVEGLLSQKADHSWSVTLPATNDLKEHQAFVNPPMTRPGYYVVIASAREQFERGNNVLHGAHLVVSDLVLVSQSFGPKATATVLSATSGAPVPGTRVLLYRYDWRDRRRVVQTKTTDQHGEAVLTGGGGWGYFLYADKGGELALDTDGLDFFSRERDPVVSDTLVFTDRSIYRPEQTIHWKVVAYRGRHDAGRFQVVPRAKLRVSLRDANYEQVAVRAVTTNAYGSAAGEFTIPAGRLLGHWTLEATWGGSASLRVEEYKRPTFEARLLETPAGARLNQPITLKGEARYYFGLPVAAGNVRWRVERSPVYPWWWGYYRWYSAAASSGVETVATGQTTLSADGGFALTFTPAADARQAKTPDLSYRYAVTAEVTDEGGETRSASRSLRLGFVAVEATVDVEAGFVAAGQPASVTVRRTNLDGDAAPGQGTYRLVAVQQPQATLLPADQPLDRPPGVADDGALRLPGDLLRPRWEAQLANEAVMRGWPDGAEKARGAVTHDQSGAATITWPALPPGVYRLRYETRDAAGATFSTARELVVAGPRTALRVPAVLLAERSSVPVGGTARLLVGSGLTDQPLAFEIYRGGERRELRRLRADASAELVDLPVTEADRGGFSVVLWLQRDHQLMTLQQDIFVPWDNQELTVELGSFRDRLRPGASETWTVKVTGPAGATTPVAAVEVLAYMYDRSLDFFTPHAPPSPLGLYPSRTGALLPRAGLGIAPSIWVDSDGFDDPASYSPPSADALQFFSGYGIGGPGRRAFGSSYPPSPSVRAEKSSSGARLMRKGNGGRDNGGEEEKAVASAPEAPADKPAALAGDKAPDAAVPAKDAGAAPAVEVRTDFSETAFFFPQLLTGADGAVSFSFTVPDSVTSWNVWAHALTKELKAGSVRKESRTVKELMVRPYLPRFLREGDTAELKVVVNNAAEQELKGELSFDILDPATDKSVLARFGLDAAKATLPFRTPAQGSANLVFPVKAPAELGLVAFRVTARAGALSDGELRPLPILPGRMHLAQSRFATLRREKRRELHFADLAKDDDPTRIHEQLVVTVDAQLFYAVLQALPYLVNYPYECTEQTLNRFLSTGIVSSLYHKYPAIGAMAKEMSKRKTIYERWDQPDPNRRMALEEAPWLRLARGGDIPSDELINVLNPAIARAHRQNALEKLRKAQTASGGFPWFPGGPPSPWMTLYLLHGFSKGLEFEVDVPRDMIERAWGFVHRHYLDAWVRECMARDGCWESITFLNYTLSSYPDASWTGDVFSEKDRRTMLEFSFKHWKEHSPYLKGYLALTLSRMQRTRDARLVWDSVMDSAKSEKDQGTFWAPEDRAWLWYNDTIETHAFAVRTLMELSPQEPKLDGLVLWLFLNKKLNHWKSTRATAEVVYALAKYLDQTGELGAREEATVTIGDRVTRLDFAPNAYTGKKNQIVIPGAELVPAQHATVVIDKPTPGFLFASATWHFSSERMPAEASGDFLTVSRAFFRRDTQGRAATLAPLADGAKIAIGDELEVQLSIRAKHALEYVHLRDPRGAGFEPVSNVSQHRWDLGIYWYEEIRDSGTNFFFEHLPQGEYTFKYRLRATTAGTFKVAPAILQPLYAPEFVAYSSGTVIGIRPQ